VLGALVVVAALAAGGWFLLHSRLLSARVVTVTGSAHTPAAAVVAAAGLARRPPLLDIDPAAVAARVERLAWVDTATVVRHWPDGVSISVVERTPVAVVTGGAAGGAWAEVDGGGRVLVAVAAPPAGLVRVVAPVTAGAPGSTLGPAARPGLSVAATLPPAFAGQVTEVDVGGGGQVTLKLTTPVTVNLGSTAQLAAKYEDVAALLARATLTAGDVLDVSVPESPLVSGP
jgi:cell division protein FtsQ